MASSHCLSILNEPYSPEMCADFRRMRSRVMCRAWELMDKQRMTFKEAVNAAWKEVKAGCVQTKPPMSRIVGATPAVSTF